VQQGGDQRRGVHAQLGQDGRHGQRVGDVRIARLALLPLVLLRSHVVGPLQQPEVGLRGAARGARSPAVRGRARPRRPAAGSSCGRCARGPGGATGLAAPFGAATGSGGLLAVGPPRGGLHAGPG
jgi:hypothetical protein